MPGLQGSSSWKRIQSSCILWQKHRLKKCYPVTPLILFRPLDTASASSKLTFCPKINIPIERVFKNGLSSAPFWCLQAESPALCFVSWAPGRVGRGPWGSPLICIQLSCFVCLSSARIVSCLLRSTCAQRCAEYAEKQNKEPRNFRSRWDSKQQCPEILCR